ncbi:MAG: Histidine--tRNA ligase [Candidatus Heimdallarchaeota archaeon LC_3]|nr:MAG: Histidine--tRNA ligase [Candidatus Heimdallarchaeota archaeon LC_3]
MELRLLKGTNDYLPKEQIIRSRIKEILTETFELYSYRPLETPILEFYDILASKYAGGAEILKETYNLTDQGERKLALRYDLTVPLSRVIGMNPHLKMPFKRYEIGKVFRDGPVKLGRVREFTQCDVDIIGIKSMQAEAELIALANDVFNRLNIDVKFEINNRKILSGILLQSGFSDEDLPSAILSLDKLKKIGRVGVEAELEEKGLKGEPLEKSFKLLDKTGSTSEILKFLSDSITQELALDGLKEIEELFKLLKIMSIPDDKVKFIPSLARGLEIYTATVFEAFAIKSPITSSLAGGGRYDEIIRKFLQTDKLFPAVGISFGLEPIYETLLSLDEKIDEKNRVLVISIKSDEIALQITSKLRSENIITEYDFRQKGVSKSLDYANTEKFTWIIIIGPKEVKERKYTLKNMETGEENKISVKEIINTINNQP